MRTRMDDTVHVQIQVVKFNLIRVWLSSINRLRYSITFLRLESENKCETFCYFCMSSFTSVRYYLIFNTLNYDRWILFSKPSEECRNSHGYIQSNFRYRNMSLSSTILWKKLRNFLLLKMWNRMFICYEFFLREWHRICWKSIQRIYSKKRFYSN